MGIGNNAYARIHTNGPQFPVQKVAQYLFRRKCIRERVAPVLLNPVEDNGGLVGRQESILVREPRQEKPGDDPKSHGNRTLYDLHILVCSVRWE